MLDRRPTLFLQRKPFPFDFRKKAAPRCTVNYTRHIYYSRVDIPYFKEYPIFFIVTWERQKDSLH